MKKLNAFERKKSRKTGEETLNFAQLRKFIEKITGNSENTKMPIIKLCLD